MTDAILIFIMAGVHSLALGSACSEYCEKVALIDNAIYVNVCGAVKESIILGLY